MRKVFSVIGAILVAVTLISCIKEKVEDIKIIGDINIKEDLGDIKVTIEKSNKFCKDEIDSAIEIVKKEFKNFKGCKLTDLLYEEDYSNEVSVGYIENGNGSVNGVKAENIIVLKSNFDVGAEGGDGSLNPNSTYEDWNWILIRDSKTSSWNLDDWEY